MSTNKKSSFICLFILIILWELFARLHNQSNFLIPPFSQIMHQLWVELCNFNLIKATVVSMKFVLIGYIISVFLSLFVSVFCMKFDIIKNFFNTLYKILSPLPSVAILPVIFLITGLNYQSMILLLFHSVFWPMLASNIMGFSSIPTIWDDFAQNICLSPLKKYTLVYIPAAFPHIITGLRTSWGRSWRSLISAEAIFGISGSTQGLGYYIYYHRAFANMTNVFAGIIMICIISLFAEEIFSFIEKNTIQKWGTSK